MRNPDLSGTLIVLMHPRTGSSLVMQTLRLLGVEVVGEAAREAFPADANPKGFFEDLDLLRDGLTAGPLRDNPALLRGKAVKLALTPLVRRGPGEWDAFAEQRVKLLFPIRSPAETFASRRDVLLRGKDEASIAFKLFRSSATNYLHDLAFLATRFSSGDAHGAPPECLDYRLATDDPAAYVGRIARASGVSPSDAQLEAAVNNIDRGLYRYRSDAGGAAHAIAKGVRPLQVLHERLLGDDPDKWQRLHQHLPRWLVAQG